MRARVQGLPVDLRYLDPMETLHVILERADPHIYTLGSGSPSVSDKASFVNFSDPFRPRRTCSKQL
jgi:hypothetical protein